jgi:hypothetical protein
VQKSAIEIVFVGSFAEKDSLLTTLGGECGAKSMQ